MFGIFLRLNNLNTTYPINMFFSKGIFNDEGVLASNARSKVLSGKWMENDKFSYGTPYFLLPAYNYLVYITFSLFGIGIIPLRSMHVLIFVLSFFSIYLILRHEKVKQQYIVFGLIIYSFSFFNILFGRVGFTENPLSLTIGLAAYCFLLSKKRKVFAFFSGVLSVISVFIKTFGLLVIPVFLFLYLLDYILSLKSSGRSFSGYIQLTLLFLTGVLLCGGMFWFFHFNLNFEQVQAWIAFEKDPLGTHVPSLSNFIFDSKDVLNMGAWHIIYNLLWIPEIISIFLMFLLCLNKNALKEVDGKIVFTAIFIVFFVFSLSMKYKPPRRFLMLVFPGSILSAYFLEFYLNMRSGTKRIFISSLFIFPMFCMLSRALGLEYGFLSSSMSWEESTLYIGMALTFTLYITSLLMGSRGVFMSQKRVVIAFSLVFFVCNLFSYLNVLTASKPWIYDIGLKLGNELPEGSIVIGPEISSMALENKLIPCRYWRRSVIQGLNVKYYSEKISWDPVKGRKNVINHYPLEKKVINGDIFSVSLVLFEHDAGEKCDTFEKF